MMFRGSSTIFLKTFQQRSLSRFIVVAGVTLPSVRSIGSRSSDGLYWWTSTTSSTVTSLRPRLLSCSRSANSSRSTLSLTGKVSVLRTVLQKHRGKVLVVGGCVGVVVFGVALSALGVTKVGLVSVLKSVLGVSAKVVATLVGLVAIYSILKAFKRLQTLMLYEPLIAELYKSRKAIERVIGPFEVPNRRQIHVGIKEGQEGGFKYPILMYSFRLQGSSGVATGMMKGVHLQQVFDKTTLKHKNEWKIEKLELSLQNLEDPTNRNEQDLMLVEKKWIKLNIVTNVEVLQEETK